MTIKTTGNVGIGTASPIENLQVVGNIFTSSGKFRSNMPGTAGAGATVCYSGSGYFDACTSLRKFKTDIAPIDIGLETVMRLRPVSYTWKASGQKDIGFIAEEASAIDARFGSMGTNGKLTGVEYSHMVAVLTKAIQELKAANDDLRSANDALTKRVDTLEAARAP
ncbi:MAG: tail fiber domain-containing protein [Alphaproteobacteria bacterium]|nr:tail fiber domain-containing protein [Alphaproteobacteria bacterium]